MDKSSKNNNTEIQLRKINREIWWLETKIDWLRLVSYRCVATPIHIIPAVFVFVVYFPVRDFFVLFFEGYLKSVVSIMVFIILFAILLFYINAVDKKVEKKLKKLNENLILLYKKRRNISDKLKT